MGPLNTIDVPLVFLEQKPRLKKSIKVEPVKA